MSTKTFFIILGAITIGAVSISTFSNPANNAANKALQSQTISPVVTNSPSPTDYPTDTPIPTAYQAPSNQPSTQVSNNSDGLSNDNYYNNSDGNQVHSPAYSNDGSVPTGATAQCADGTYSFSQHRSGTCSYHGGVVTWY
jgi:hypothetical protein